MTTIDNNVKIPLSDGIILSARVWFAEGSGPFPAILEYHPYPKRYITAERDEIGHGYFSKQGFVSLRVDMRGSGDSEGFLSDEYTEQARKDAVEVISWIADQEWCTGTVGMYGLSWGGFNGIQMATKVPKALKAIAVAGAPDDRFISDTHFKGGVMASEHFGWAATLLSFLSRRLIRKLLARTGKKCGYLVWTRCNGFYQNGFLTLPKTIIGERASLVIIKMGLKYRR